MNRTKSTKYMDVVRLCFYLGNNCTIIVVITIAMDIMVTMMRGQEGRDSRLKTEHKMTEQRRAKRREYDPWMNIEENLSWTHKRKYKCNCNVNRPFVTCYTYMEITITK